MPGRCAACHSSRKVRGSPDSTTRAGQPPPGPFWYWAKAISRLRGVGYALADLRMLHSPDFRRGLSGGRAHLFLIGVREPIFRHAAMALTFLTRRQVRVFRDKDGHFDSAKGLAHDYVRAAILNR